LARNGLVEETALAAGGLQHQISFTPDPPEEVMGKIFLVLMAIGIFTLIGVAAFVIQL
jgi:hypothetical protein